MKQKLPERRRFVRIEVLLRLTVKCGDFSEDLIIKNVSPVGVRFEVTKELDKSKALELALYLPSKDGPISLEGRVVWQKRSALEDGAKYDTGVEITIIDEEDKNTFLKYLCDLLYESIYEDRT